MNWKVLKSKRNRHTGRVNAAKQRILDATLPLNVGNRIIGFSEYVTQTIDGTRYKGVQTRSTVPGYPQPLPKITVTLVRETFIRG